MAKLRITYTKSAIGYSRDQKATIQSLGLRKLHSTAIHDDTPAIRGMTFKVRHLVTVEEIADAQTFAAPQKRARPIVKPAPAVSAVAPAEPAAPTSVAPAEPVIRAAAVPTGPDDLVVIEGIGPKIASVLQAAGITTFAQLAAADVQRLEEILGAADVNLRLAPPDTWPEQAALAAAGKWDEFKQLTDQLKGGRRA